MTKRLKNTYDFIRFYKEDLWGRLFKSKYKKKFKINRTFLEKRLKFLDRKNKINLEKKRLKELYLKPYRLNISSANNREKIKYSKYLSQFIQKETNYRLYKLNLLRFIQDLKETQSKFNFRIDVGKPKSQKRMLSMFGKRLLNRHLLRNFHIKALSAKQFRVSSKKMRKYISSFFFFGNFFELRIDALFFRLNFVSLPGEARQLINHGQVLVNGKIKIFPNFKLINFDIFSLKNKNFFFNKLYNLLKKKLVNSLHLPYFVECNYRILSFIVYKTPLFFKLTYPLRFKPLKFANNKGAF